MTRIIIAWMIIPYGHETKRGPGRPWATITIFVLCLVFFLLTLRGSDRSDREAAELFGEIAETFIRQPTLVLDPETESLLIESLGVDENQREIFIESLIAESPGGGNVTQTEMDGLIHRFREVRRSSPHYRFGVVPTHITPVTLLTYQFLHGGWVHLLGNLLFLYLAAPHMEDRWGPWVFTGFYLLAGVIAALFWAIRYPEIDVPLVGASGSIAGVMGAFLICFGTSKIRFFYWFFIVWGTFEAPAWLMLPLWLVMEVVSGRSMDVLSEGGGGVAHWAHVWGFIFGMAAAFGMRVLGIDQRLAARSAPETGEADHSRRRDGSPRSRPSTDVYGRADVASGQGLNGGAEIGDESVRHRPDSADGDPSARRGGRVEAVGPNPIMKPTVVEAAPRSLDVPFLLFEVEGRSRRLDLTGVAALAVGAVRQENQRPFFIVDLLLDSPSGGGGEMRILRFPSTAFDPRSLVGGDDAMAAFVGFLDTLLSVSGAQPLPDEPSVRAPMSRIYGSIEDYQHRVLGVEA